MTLWEILQQHGVHGAHLKASDAKFEAGRAQEQIRDLHQQLEDLGRRTNALAITCQALWEIVRTEHEVDDRAILAKMEEIDLRDGTRDGKMTPTLRECPQCKQRTRDSRKHCLYCGSEMPVDHIFEKS